MNATRMKVWLIDSFAPEWYQDALNDVRGVEGHHSRRREVLFAVCCIESYLFEWVRDDVLNQEFSLLENYFPENDRRGIQQRWKEVIKTLHSEGKIKATPGFGEPYWIDFIKLVNFRDGLVHGKSSRPSSKSQDKEREPLPSKNDLDDMEPGWATRTITNTIEKLHEAVDTQIPDWLAIP